MKLTRGKPKVSAPAFPGIATATDGSGAVIAMETAASEAAGAYPITPSTQMGEGFAAAMAAGKPNVNGRQLIFFEPEGEHAAAAVTAGMSMTGLRSSNFSSGQGVAYMHESLYAAVGKRLTYVLNMACRAMTKHALNVHAGHDDYHAIDDTGFFQLFAKDVQESADLNLIAHRIAELALNPGIIGQDGFLTSHVLETLRMPERELVREYLGDPADMIASPTPAQRMVFGETRRRIPEMFDMDFPAMLGVVQNQDAYAQGVAAQRPFYFDHIEPLTEQAFAEYAALTGRRYQRASGYLLDDAEYVIAGQGSVVSNAEVVAEHLRKTRGLKVGILNVTMFRPFPSDRITELLRGKKAVTVLERLDQPLAVDPPLLREIRAAMTKGLENGRGNGQVPHPGIAPCKPKEIPDFFAGCFGMGSRDLQPGDVLAAVHNMLPDGEQRRFYYLGIDFIRPETRLPKMQIWQDEMSTGYPDLQQLSLPSAGDFNLMPEGATSLRIHSVGGWGAITMGKNLALTVSGLMGLHIKANPKYGSEKKGQPTTFYATLSPEPVRLNCELKHVDTVLSPDPNVFQHSNPLAGLEDGGVLVIQNDRPAAELWASLPRVAQRAIREKGYRVYHVDGFKIANAESPDPNLRYRMQGTAFLGAFFRVAPIVQDSDLDEARLFEGLRGQVEKKFGHLGDAVVESNLRAIRRGYDAVEELDWAALEEGGLDAAPPPAIPPLMCTPSSCGIADPGRFWEQVGYLYQTGDDGLADPFAAISAIPAATSSIRDMTGMRMEVPDFIASKCTGCSQCWVQCPDAAIPGVVNSVEQVLEAAIKTATNGRPLDRIKQGVRHLAKESRRILASSPFNDFTAVLKLAYENVAPKLASDPERRAALDAEFAPVAAALAEFPLAKTGAYFDGPEAREKGSGGLLSITVNPEACKGCNVCVDVCPDGALVTVKQDDDIVERLRRNWTLWENLPDTDDRFVQVSDLEEGIGVLASILLKKENYRSMVGGDGACMGCGEKTAIHLVLSAVYAMMLPRVEKRVAKLDDLIAKLDAKARGLLASDANLDDLASLKVPADKKDEVERIAGMLRALKDLRWRYTEGPAGKGRAHLGFANSTGCSSVWGSTYPYNPYPFPWVNHLFQDAPSIAIGLFEGHMRRMADGFASVRRAELELDGRYDAAVDEPGLNRLTWQEFTDEEFALCPPIFAVGGDGAMMDIGFQNLSRLMASGKPIRVIVLDTQVYSNTGGQACTSGFTGQVSDMAEFGGAHHGKEEVRKELSLIAMAHRGTYVLQSAQAASSHLMAGVLKGLNVRRPAIFLLHCPCPPEHGIGDDASFHQSKLAIESRAFPILRYDPDAGDTLAECLDLDGNPAMDDEWPAYELKYVDDDGAEQSITLPLTIADWAATEARFKKHFKKIGPDMFEGRELVAFHEYLQRPEDELEDEVPFIQALDNERRLIRMAVSPEIVELAKDRLGFWSQLCQIAGGVADQQEERFDDEIETLRAEYEQKIADLKARYPQLVARRLAEGLLKASKGRGMEAILADAAAAPALPPAPVAPVAPMAAGPAGAVAVAEAPPVAAPVEDDDDLGMEPYIESARCTTCNECTNINAQLFAYNEKKQAYIKDASAGTFKQIVQAAERCPVRIIHPGTPLNPKEKGLDKWLKRAEPFN
ncbi:MAG: 2-oxoacid:acceptor oxidoreductase family protein [Planctomycetota bacterium]|jgi:pyruvate-ferredoxin/flavodoxin oxidoreductase